MQMYIRREKYLKKIIGFTLAEVIIVMGVIGVVAAITIPNLVAEYQKTQYVSALKKAYAEINLVLKQMATDAGCPSDLTCTGFFSTLSNANVTIATAKLGKSMVTYMKVINDCGASLPATWTYGCFSTSINHNIDGSSSDNSTTDINSNYNFITTDGMTFSVYNFLNDCEDFVISQACGMLYVDINGFKPPNYMGRDVFKFFITNENGPHLYPYGGQKEASNGDWWKPSNYCSKNRPDGALCAGRIIENGWVMDY